MVRQDAWLVGSGTLVLRESGGVRLPLRGGSLVRDDGADPIPLPCPRERAEELAAVRSWLARSPTRVEAADVAPAEPVDGGARLARVLARVREADRPPTSRSRHPG